MKYIIRIIIKATIISLFVFSSTSLFAQKWSKEQNEIWKNVEAYTGLWAKGDVKGIMEYFHDDFIGWGSDTPLPNNKSSREKAMIYYFPRTEVLFYELSPAAINIYGKTAVVHYFLSIATKNNEGKTTFEELRWTDILKKQGNKWVMIADHGG